MKRRLLVIFSMVLVGSVSAMWAGDVNSGKETFSKKCTSCHGLSGEGKDAVAKMLKVELRPLASKEVQAKSDADFKKTILEGQGKMKPVKDVDAKSADDIVSYLRTLADKK